MFFSKNLIFILKLYKHGPFSRVPFSVGLQLGFS